MTEMIERVAHVLCGLAGTQTLAQDPAPEVSVADGDPNWQSFIPAARTIIDALREPTEGMKIVGAEFFEEGDAKQNAFAAAILYGAMMDAALGDEQPTA